MEAERTSLGAMPYMTDNPNTAFVVRERVRNGEMVQLKQLIKEMKGVGFTENFLKPGPTIRGYTPLHIACWGTSKPHYDRDIVELILRAAKKAGKDAEAQVRSAKDSVSGETPLDLVRDSWNCGPTGVSADHIAPVCAQVKQRLVRLDADPPKPGADDKDFLDEKQPVRVTSGILCGIRQLAAPPGAPGLSPAWRAAAPTHYSLSPDHHAGRGWQRWSNGSRRASRRNSSLALLRGRVERRTIVRATP